jgi:hypothetical protein
MIHKRNNREMGVPQSMSKKFTSRQAVLMRLVAEILNEYPKTRNDDRLLIQLVYHNYFGFPFQKFDVLTRLPPQESLSRARRKIQETRFKATEQRQKYRREWEKQYRKYYAPKSLEE